MPLTTSWPVGSVSPHPKAPYRDSDRTDATPRNAVYVARNPRLDDAPQLVDGKQHNRFDYGMTKFFESTLDGQMLTNETGTHQYGDQRFARERRGDWRFSVAKFERLLDDAVQGVQAARGRVVEESVFTDGLETIAFLDTIKGNELLVQTVADGNLITKVIDEADLDPAFAKTLDLLDVYERP